MKNILIPIILITGLIIAYASFKSFLNRNAELYSSSSTKSNNPTSNSSTSQKTIFKNIKVGDTTINVELVNTPEGLQMGLSDRKSLDQNSGMLFQFNENSRPTFWMKYMYFPIDIIWIDNNKIVGIEKNVPNPPEGTPEDDLKLYPSPQNIDYVLEVNGGFSDTHSFKVGDVIEVGS